MADLAGIRIRIQMDLSQRKSWTTSLHVMRRRLLKGFTKTEQNYGEQAKMTSTRM